MKESPLFFFFLFDSHKNYSNFPKGLKIRLVDVKRPSGFTRRLSGLSWGSYTLLFYDINKLKVGYKFLKK